MITSINYYKSSDTLLLILECYKQLQFTKMCHVLRANAHIVWFTAYSNTYRLLYGEGVDLLTLAKNVRTPVNMAERHYASTLNGEMNINILQSKRDEH